MTMTDTYYSLNSSYNEECSSEDSQLKLGIYYPRNKQNCQKNIRALSKRLVFKNGEFNIDYSKIFKQSCFSRWFIRMIDARWRWALLHFFTGFTCNWLAFGFIYWAISLAHGDLSEDHLPPHQNVTNWVPCVKNNYGFTSCFLFSVEVHTTVAYGRRSITLECPGLITAMCFQCIICQIFQAFMIGILFAKLTRPKSRTQTILFSRQAVITLRDGKFCMIFRVGDMRKARLLNIKVSAFLLKLINTDTDIYEHEQIELELTIDGCESTFFLWPISAMHVIDQNSPLYDVSAADLLLGKFEILAVFEGLIESTGQEVQARTSYTEFDILWGHRFIPMVKSDQDRKVYDVDFSKLSETKKFDTPLCSPSEFTAAVSVDQFETY